MLTPMHYCATLLLALASLSIGADREDGLTLALAARPTVVIAAAIDPELPGVLTESQLKEDAEIILRQNKIPVAEHGDGALIISVRSYRFTLREASLYAVLPAVTYSEHVVTTAALVRCGVENTDRREIIGCTELHNAFGELWRQDSLMQVGEARLRDLRSTIKDLVQKFVLEYLRANESKK